MVKIIASILANYSFSLLPVSVIWATSNQSRMEACSAGGAVPRRKYFRNDSNHGVPGCDGRTVCGI
ncbi:hypothetical protein P152DRAFT_454286 [Eremomyces bilateralis CBS 781.70]|uniref:Uncharacterized protein n=1 Tax=Eremomyces bilateralis CBS 781.70 TaxID=1392243 RepID=A0A6G1GDA9_9PEZI|nr:uncharacterized protein P152DRAFT_454286 [Eremomyces bilateralis CBS 781.70]KAF1816038.1 hypothetical protein P152DRAFT_454286 [Eremomyces bilateralis CBS 781.70]